MATAEGKQRLETQLATLRARDGSVAAAELEAHQRKKAELKFRLKNHMDPPVPPQPEGGASAFLRNVTDSLPSNGGAAGGTGGAVFSGFPNFTPPTQDDLGDFAGTVSFGSAMGFCSGYALKKIGRAGATTVGIIFMSLTAAERSGYINVRWDNIERDVMKKVPPPPCVADPKALDRGAPLGVPAPRLPQLPLHSVPSQSPADGSTRANASAPCLGCTWQLDQDGDGKVDATDAQIALKKFTSYMTDKNSAVTGGTFTAGLLLGLRRG